MTAAPRTAMTPHEQAQLLRFVRGRPDEEHIAAATLAVLAVLRARNRAAPATPGDPAFPAPTWGLDRTYRSPGSWTAARRRGASA
ncbi:acyl-CoA carboxylase epsilon subunit [Streptomyces globisporus]|uniref:acyl-CoA carboxylase epsilon subunit n=1 Tax=Streptomyces globisporus TaxID=1908 RepID=UPI0004C66671|nr:acyl-CoA carboxylase epsilon subunit [Streptomyces globisporus]